MHMPRKVITLRPKPKISKFKTKPRVQLKENTSNPHIRTVNTLFSSAKTTSAQFAKLKFCYSSFAKKRRKLERILIEIKNNTSPEKIFREIEHFDIAEYKAIGREKYCANLAKEILSLKQAYNYADNILRKYKK